MLLNEFPSRLLQMRMNGSVGKAGQNDRRDVGLMQQLLNTTKAQFGASYPALVVDGACGPRTIEAIFQYQFSRGLHADARVDAYGATAMKLVRDLNVRSALPSATAGIERPRPEIMRAFAGQSNQITSSSNAAKTSGATGNGTGWRIRSSGSMDVSYSIFGGTVINVYLAHDTEPNIPYRITFMGAGVGLSTSKFGMDLSTESFPSWGTEFKRCTPLAKRPPFNVHEFDLLPTIVISVGGNALVAGWSGTVIIMDGKYAAAMTGLQIGEPGVGVTMYAGVIAGWV